MLSLSDAVESDPACRAEKRDRLIVAWSNHELNVVERDCPEHLERFKARYVNARTLIVNWRNARHGGAKPQSNTLAAYFTYLGIRCRTPLAPAGRAQTIKVLQDAFARGKRVEQLTDNQRARWDDAHRPQRPRLRRACGGSSSRPPTRWPPSDRADVFVGLPPHARVGRANGSITLACHHPDPAARRRGPRNRIPGVMEGNSRCMTLRRRAALRRR